MVKLLFRVTELETAPLLTTPGTALCPGEGGS